MIRPTVSYSSLVLLTMLVFAAGDLYFGYKDQTCSHASITNTKIGFGMGTWLKISGYTNLIYILFPLVSYSISKCLPSLILVYMVFATLFVFFRIIWLIVGGIIFWGHLWPSRICSPNLNTYMWINLLYSSLIIMVLCYNQQKIYTTTYISKTTI